MQMIFRLAALFVLLSLVAGIVFASGAEFGLATTMQQIWVAAGLLALFLVIAVVYISLAKYHALKSNLRDLGSAWITDASTGDMPGEKREQLRAAQLRDCLRERHGWRWRHRQRWLLLCGEDAAIDQIAPGLRHDGWAMTPQVVLLYGGVANSTHYDNDGSRASDSGWLKQIARTHRHRPIDAVVIAMHAEGIDKSVGSSDSLAQQLYRQSLALGWAAPAYVLHIGTSQGWSAAEPQAIACTWSQRTADGAAIEIALATLSQRLAEHGVEQLKRNTALTGLASLSHSIEQRAPALAQLLARLAPAGVCKNAIHGILFAPALSPAEVQAARSASSSGSLLAASPLSSAWHDFAWQAIARHSATLRGCRVGWSFTTLAACCVMVVCGLWMAGSLIAGASNRFTIANAEAVTMRLKSAQTPVAAARDLDLLQRQIDSLEQRQQQGAPWRARFGVNHDGQVLHALWPHYKDASQRILSVPLQRQLEADLQQRNAWSDQELADSGEEQVKAAYADLKTYLMLAQPQHTDAAFLSAQWLASGQPEMPSQSEITHGGWLDLNQRLVRFHVRHLARHQDWAITPDAMLVASARQSLSAVIGLQNSTEVVYQAILATHAGKYPDLSLQSLLGNTSSRGLFSIAATVPGVYTKAAWDERISKAIEQADQQRSGERDWVLADGSAVQLQQQEHVDLQQALRQRYFADYARAWEAFLNSAQWHVEDTLSGTIDQLTLLADAQRSPLLALFNAVSYQASAGTTVTSLADNLVSKAQQLVKSKELDPAKLLLPAGQQPPLMGAFEPLLRLHQSAHVATGSNSQSNNNTQVAAAQLSDMSLARYLERITAVRLKLQQIMMSREPEAVSRSVAQAILQGKTSDLADSRDYASRVGASLGKQWSGFGDALFERPLEQTLNVVLQPAAANLNDIWRSAIVASWNQSFAGRYPFADTDNDVSLPELARFLRRDGGLIGQFVETQLAGMLERQGDQWIATQVQSGRQLQLDPAFIAAVNQLTQISNRLFAEGDARMRFELKPMPTEGILDIRLVSGGQQWMFSNENEQWQAMAWPDAGLSGATQLLWHADQSGMRAQRDVAGRFGLIRLLSQAQVTQLDSAQYQLVWQPDASGAQLRLLLRSEVGAGPLEVLKLRNFRLPQRIFMTAAPRNNNTGSADSADSAGSAAQTEG